MVGGGLDLHYEPNLDLKLQPIHLAPLLSSSNGRYFCKSRRVENAGNTSLELSSVRVCTEYACNYPLVCWPLLRSSRDRCRRAMERTERERTSPIASLLIWELTSNPPGESQRLLLPSCIPCHPAASRMSVLSPCCSWNSLCVGLWTFGALVAVLRDLSICAFVRERFSILSI